MGKEHEQTIYFKKYSGDWEDIPYYPVRLAYDKDILQNMRKAEK